MQIYSDEKTFWESLHAHIQGALPDWTVNLLTEDLTAVGESENYTILAKSPRYTYDLLVRCDNCHAPGVQEQAPKHLMDVRVSPMGQGGWPIANWSTPPDDPELGEDIQQDARELNEAMASWSGGYLSPDGTTTMYGGWAPVFNFDRIGALCEMFGGETGGNWRGEVTVVCSFADFELEVWPDGTFLPEFVFRNLRPCMGADAARAGIQRHRKAVDLYELILRTFWPPSPSLEDPS